MFLRSPAKSKEAHKKPLETKKGKLKYKIHAVISVIITNS